MLPKPPDPKETGFYFSLGQVGLEMVVPIVVGQALDHYFQCAPWCVVAGAIAGLVGGLTHLVYMLNQRDQAGTTKPK